MIVVKYVYKVNLFLKTCVIITNLFMLQKLSKDNLCSFVADNDFSKVGILV